MEWQGGDGAHLCERLLPKSWVGSDPLPGEEQRDAKAGEALRKVSRQLPSCIFQDTLFLELRAAWRSWRPSSALALLN